ncbi:MAG: tRNA (N6-threonylcarbamoyladenosine(37)-N6)-methyltransferase TrmO [Candidatus Bathyarchaeia archaeon]|jgi:tRNA-Thr(GGU) m(6)t(6)A37 methyltransferase TsaA
MGSKEPIVLQPIGFVRTIGEGNEVKNRNLVSKIELREDLTEALEGLAEFSHIFVLFYLNQITNEELPFKIHPQGRTELPLVGVYATRTSLRPNQIGLTVVELLKIEGSILTVRGLDAYNDSPVLDIKPYDLWDSKSEIKVPEWRKQLEEENQGLKANL